MKRPLIRWICVLAAMIALLPMTGWSGHRAASFVVGDGETGCAAHGAISRTADDCCASLRYESRSLAGETCTMWGSWCAQGGCSGMCFCCVRPNLLTMLAGATSLTDEDGPTSAVAADRPSQSHRAMPWVTHPRSRFGTGPPRSLPTTLIALRSLLLI